MSTPQPTTTPAADLIALQEVFDYLAKTILLDSTTAETHRAMFARVLGNREAITGELTKLKKAQLERFAGFSARGETKPRLVKSAWHHILQSFALSDSIEYGMREEFEDVMQRYVDQVTDDTLVKLRASREAAVVRRANEQDATAKAVADPQTLDDFEICVRKRGIAKLVREETKVPKGRGHSAEIESMIRRAGESELTDDELARYDELRAAVGQERRAKQLVEKATIKRIEIGEGNYMEVLKIWHSKREVDVWLVVLAEREDRTTYEEMCIAAYKLGGHYQRAWRGDADSEARPGGFQFMDEASALQFVETQSRDVFVMKRLERLVARRDRVRANAVDHFTTLGGRMLDRAGDNLAAIGEHKLNTERRVMQAENAKDREHSNIAMALTLRTTAEALLKRVAVHTDRIRWRTHAEAFNEILASAEQHMGNVVYPWPVVGVHTLKEIALQIGDRDGSKMISARILKWCETVEVCRDHQVHFHNSYMADSLRHFYRRARLHRVRGWALDTLRYALGNFKRVRLMGLDTLPELRAALREHLGRRVEASELTRAEKVMRDLYPGSFPPDYFPTPRDVVEMMLEYADMDDGMIWLEPSAGSGHILNVVREKFPSALPTSVEIAGLLCKALNAQGYSVFHEDFLKLRFLREGENVINPHAYDRVIMNPPFGCDGVGTDIDHVFHAYQFLKPGGRLVSLMSEGVFYRTDKKAEGFRAWLGSLNGDSFEVPEGAFLNSDRPTSWATRIVVVDKLSDAERAEEAEIDSLAAATAESLGVDLES